MKGTVGNGAIRYAVVNTVHDEVLTANHQVIGEAFNSMMEDYNTPKNLVVVATQNDRILGEVRRNGSLKKNGLKLPATIWDGAKHPFYDPETANRLSETARQFLAEITAKIPLQPDTGSL